MALPELPESRYATAAATRARSLGDIALDKYDAGSSGVAGSYAQAAKEKLAASSMRMKERFDPLNMVQGLTGSRLLTSAAGKMMGRSTEDVDYFRDKAMRRDTARDVGTDSSDGRDAVRSKISSEQQKKLAESQVKINNLILTGKTTLYPKDEIVDGLNDLYDLIDERMPISGGSTNREETGRYIPGQQSATPKPKEGPSLIENVAEGYIGKKAVEKVGGWIAQKLGMGAVAEGAAAATTAAQAGTAATAATAAEAGTAATIAGTGAASLIAPAAIVGAGAAYIGFKGFQVQKATPKDVPDFDEEDDPQYAYLQDLVQNVRPRDYMTGLAGTQGPEKIPLLLQGVANRVPPEDRKDFAALIHSKTDGKEPQDQLYGLREAIDEYVAKKVADIKKSKGKAGRWDVEGARTAQVTQDIAQIRAETNARVTSTNTKAESITPPGYKGDVTRFARDKAAAAAGDAKAIARLKSFGVDAEGKPLSGNQEVAPVPTTEQNMNNLNQARVATSSQSGAAPVIINASGDNKPAAPTNQTASVVPPPGSATTNGSTNRFEDKLMGGNADFIP